LNKVYAMIDLRSDTVTKPCDAMREAMAAAEVGDDVYGEDPTVNALEAEAARLLGKEAALFVPTGTMANLVAILAQTHPGETLILSREAHPFQYEGGNIAAFGGLLACTIDDPLGKMTPAQAEQQILQADDPHFSPTTLVSIENTTNRGGGACYTPEEVAAMGALFHGRGLRLHCDGARIFNAAVALGVAPKALTAPCDTVSFCLSKGLGAPAGSLVVGGQETIRKAHRLRKMLGGGMRQAGVLAAAGLHALAHHVEDLRADHRRAAAFREALESLGMAFALPSPTNILYIRVDDSVTAVAQLADAGVQVLPHGPGLVRVLFHRDIGDDGLEQAVAAFKRVLSS
jgi:threonine aldolase